jgi:hypothetical protein
VPVKTQCKSIVRVISTVVGSRSPQVPCLSGSETKLSSLQNERIIRHFELAPERNHSQTLPLAQVCPEG